MALFTIASLITALIINSLAINYVYSHFTNHMNTYQTSQNSRTIVDKIQRHYVCCGTSTWIEWANIGLNGTTTTTVQSVTTTIAIGETTIVEETTTAAGGGEETTTAAAGGTTTAAADEETTASEAHTTHASSARRRNSSF